MQINELFFDDRSFIQRPLDEDTPQTHWTASCQLVILQLASLLTDPICKVREHVYLMKLVPLSNASEKIKKVAYFVLGLTMAAYAVIAPIAAPIGALLRKIASLFSSTIYTHERGPLAKKVIPGPSITLVSYNVCYMPGGYAVSDGGVPPPSFNNRKRIMENNELIHDILKPDIVCLQEVPDIADAQFISSQFSDYPFIIPVAGIKAIGPSSMMYVASKCEIVAHSIEFTPFVKGTEVTGRAASSEKGFLSFDLKDTHVSIICTHLQHSEIPAKAEPMDITSRKLQMLKIAEKIQEKRNEGKIVIFTGDLNQEEKELYDTLEQEIFENLKLQRDPLVENIPTWGGDAWCAKLEGKEPSPSLVLAYTFAAGAKKITTAVIDVGFKGDEFRFHALSDHKPIYSTVVL